MSDKALTCPNCGVPPSQNISPVPQKDNIGPMVPISIIAVIVSVIGFFLISMNASNDAKPVAKSDEVPITTSLMHANREFNTVDGVRKGIDGTIWTYTNVIGENDNFNVWCRLEFRDGKLYYQEVSPSEGEWGEPQICEYVIGERRYSNTGRRYVDIRWTNSLIDYSFIPETHSLCWSSHRSYSDYKLGAKLTEGDSFPWK